MTDIDVSRLDNIFRMMSPADVLGNQSLTLGKNNDSNVVKEIQRILFDNGGGGALTIDDIKSQLHDIITRADPEARKLLNRVFRVYSSTGPLDNTFGQAQYLYNGNGNKKAVSTFSDIVGGEQVVPSGKKMSVILSNSMYITPSVRNADKVEMFLNSMPSIVMSRCIPYLEVEFVFDRPDQAPLQSASLLKFLLGSPPTGSPEATELTSATPSTATGKMSALHRIVDPTTKREYMSANMELFTAPQMMINPNPVPVGSRYVDVIDPFRPFASLESFVINVTPTVGLFSYKKASMKFKLHDRSRLSEISELIRPQIFTDTVVWVTYGWRHPDEPGNPYADFINNNMLVREAFGIVNSGFEFDQVGQVGVTLELFTKGVTELRSMRIPDTGTNSFKLVEDRIKDLADKIATARRQLNIGAPQGLNKEIRAVQILDAAERGTFPDDLSSDDVQNAIRSLGDSFKGPGGKIDSTSAKTLIDALGKMYKTGNDKKFDFKTQIKNTATDVIRKKFDQIKSGADPFLMYGEKWAQYQAEAGLDGIKHPFMDAIDKFNTEKDINAAVVKELQDAGFAGGAKKLVSFGKLFSLFAGQSLLSIPAIDELQVYFYPFNEQAGNAGATNIAEFPIDLPLFLQQYREHVETKATERITLEEFFQLVVAAQVDDVRAVAYGFRADFAPYDIKDLSNAATTKDGEGRYENAVSRGSAGRGPFVKPVLELFVETAYKSTNGKDTNLLTQFEARATGEGSPNQGRVGDLTKIMRVHIFDKAAHPYKAAGKMLRSDVGGRSEYFEVSNDYASSMTPDQAKQLQAAALDAKGTRLSDIVQEGVQKGTINIVIGDKPFSNSDVKKLVSKMLPTIVYGTNASMVKSANLASKQDPLLSTTQMLGNKAGRASPTAPNGAGVGGMPLRIVPASMTMETLGCPLLNYAQLFFIDYGTGTTADNIYGITGLTHTFSPGKFDSQIVMTFYDAYGKYENPPSLVDFFKTLEVPEPKK